MVDEEELTGKYDLQESKDRLEMKKLQERTFDDSMAELDEELLEHKDQRVLGSSKGRMEVSSAVLIQCTFEVY